MNIKFNKKGLLALAIIAIFVLSVIGAGCAHAADTNKNNGFKLHTESEYLIEICDLNTKYYEVCDENRDLKNRITAYEHNDGYYLWDWVDNKTMEKPEVKRVVTHCGDLKQINKNLYEKNIQNEIEIKNLEDRIAELEAKNKVLEEQVDNLTNKNALLKEELELRDGAGTDEYDKYEYEEDNSDYDDGGT